MACATRESTGKAAAHAFVCNLHFICAQVCRTARRSSMTQPSMTQVSAEESVSAVSVNGLLARRLAERSVDALLPAGSILLEEVEHVAINAQRYHLLDAGVLPAV